MKTTEKPKGSKTGKVINWVFPAKSIIAVANGGRAAYVRQSSTIAADIDTINNRKTGQRSVTIADEMRASYGALLHYWGIANNPDEIARVKRGLRFESIIYMVAAMLPVAVFIGDVTCLIYWLDLLLVPVFLLVALGRQWRYDCIEGQQFVFFKEWLFSVKGA